MAKLCADQRRALEMLAESRNGCTDHVLHLLGFSDELVAELVRSGLASAEPKRRFAGRKATAVRRIKITDAGRRAL
jgi:hypothetical protein